MKKQFRLTIAFIMTLTNFYGQSTLDTKMFGQQILDGKATAHEDKKTFQLLDSLFCKNKEDKDFYFKVANKIQRNSDGALSEYVSVIAAKFYLEYNSEFIEHSKTMTKTDIDKWLYFVAYDFYANSRQGAKDLPKIKTKLENLSKKYSNASNEDSILRKKYNDWIYIQTEKNIKAN